MKTQQRASIHSTCVVVVVDLAGANAKQNEMSFVSKTNTVDNNNNALSLANVDNNNNNATIKELSFAVQLPSDVEYSDSVPRFPQKGRYAFPAGLIVVGERASFGWSMKSDGSHTNATAKQRSRRYRCLEQFLQCDKCLKIVDVDQLGEQSTKKRKTNNNNDVAGEKTDAIENRLCFDSPQCDGILRKKSCSVVSNLVVTPFLATLEVLGNHLHTHQQQQQSLVQVKSVQIQSVVVVVNGESTAATTNGKLFSPLVF